MNCKCFLHWLNSRDIHEEALPGPIQRHMDGCTQCSGLYRADNHLEQAIARAFRQEEPPQQLISRINEALAPSESQPIPLAKLSVRRGHG